MCCPAVLAAAIVLHSHHKICLRDPEAIREDYAFLTDAEYDALMSITEHSRQFLVKQGQQSAIYLSISTLATATILMQILRQWTTFLACCPVNHKAPKLRMSWLNGSVMTLKYGSKNI